MKTIAGQALLLSAMAFAFGWLFGMSHQARMDPRCPPPPKPCPVCIQPLADTTTAPSPPDQADWIELPRLSTVMVPRPDCEIRYDAGLAQGREDWRCREVWKVPEACLEVPGERGLFRCPVEQP